MYSLVGTGVFIADKKNETYEYSIKYLTVFIIIQICM